MGWFGYNIYDGDGTQSCHYDFIKTANLTMKVDVVVVNEQEWMTKDGTLIPEKLLPQFKLAIPKIVKTLPNKKFWSDDDAIEWQMFGALLLCNRIKINKTLKKKVIDATEYLMGEHAAAFDEPYKRRKILKKFIADIKKL
jgi:hypothetical protein